MSGLFGHELGLSKATKSELSDHLMFNFGKGLEMLADKISARQTPACAECLFFDTKMDERDIGTDVG